MHHVSNIKTSIMQTLYLINRISISFDSHSCYTGVVMHERVRLELELLEDLGVMLQSLAGKT